MADLLEPTAPSPDSAADRRADDRRAGDRRGGPDRRGAFDRRSGLDRRKGAGRRRTDDRRSAEEGEMTEEQFVFVSAVNDYRKLNNCPFPTWTEVLDVVKYLGYRKVAGQGEHALTPDRPDEPDSSPG